jgi:hypothetical protein
MTAFGRVGEPPFPEPPLVRVAVEAADAAMLARWHLDALRHRDFRLLWAGQTVSQIGDAAFVVALGWRAFTLTGKSSSLGIVLMVESIGLVATLLIGGVLADRYSRKLLLLGSDCARALVIAALASVDASGHLSFGCWSASSRCTAWRAASSSRRSGGSCRCSSRSPTSARRTRWSGSRVRRPSSSGRRWRDSSTASRARARSSRSTPPPSRLRDLPLVRAPALLRARADEGLRRELTTGFRYVVQVPWLWITIGTFSVVLLVGFAAFQVLLPKVVQEEWSGGVGAYGCSSPCRAWGW